MEKVLIILVLAITGLIQGRENYEPPISYEEKHSPSLMQLYAKGEAIDPNNPRLVLRKAQFEIGTAQFFGSDIKPICTQIERTIELFDNFKAETKYSPNWVKDQATTISSNCK